MFFFVTSVIIMLLIVLGLVAFLVYPFGEKSYVQIAKEADELCLDPDSEITIFECYQNFALERQDYRICDRYGEYMYEKYCEGSENYLFWSEEECSYIEDALSGSCIGWIAYNISDPDYCENGNTQLKREYCYQTYASGTQDETYCENIEDQELKEQCIDSANYPLHPPAFVMDPPFVSGDYSIDSITDTINFEIINNNSKAIYLRSSSDAANDVMDFVIGLLYFHTKHHLKFRIYKLDSIHR